MLQYDFILSAGEIDRVSEKVDDYLSSKKINGREALKIRLSAENVLLTWLSAPGDNKKCSLLCRKTLGKETLALTYEGERLDPLRENEEDGTWITALRSRLESVPVFDYNRHRNQVTFTITGRRYNRLLVLLFFLISGLALGFAGLLLPESFRSSVSANLFSPVCGAYLTIFSFCGVPLIFFSIVTGIVGAGNINTFSGIGKKMLALFGMILLVTAVLGVGIALNFFPLQFGGSGVSVAYDSIVSLLINCIPTDLFQPFVSCNALQLIVMGVLFGFAILALNKNTPYLEGVMNDLNTLLLCVSQWFTALIPLYISITITDAVWKSGAGELVNAWKPWILTLLLQILMIGLMVLLVSLKCKVSPSLLLRKVSKTFFIALGTNSCVTSIHENYVCCADKLGIDPLVFVAGIPVGTTVFKPATVLRLTVLCFVVASNAAVPISVGWIFLLFFLSVILSVAIPAVPGGVIMLCPLLFSQLGLPAEALAAVIATDVFFDSICTACNQISAEFSLVLVSDRAGLLSYDTLRKDPIRSAKRK